MDATVTREIREERCEWKDVTSAVVIFWIWVEHLGHYNVGLIRPFISRFANPVFFLVAGFFAANGRKYRYGEFVVRSVKRLLVPYGCWAVVNVVFWLFQKNITDIKEIRLGLWQYIVCDVTQFQYGGTAWFLIGLFVCKIVYEALRRLLRDVRLVSVVCLALTCVMTVMLVKEYPILNYGYTRGLYWLFFYSLGPIAFPIFNRLANKIQTNWGGVERKDRLLYWLICGIFLVIAVQIYFGKTEAIYIITNRYIRELVIQVVLPLILTIFTIILSFYIKGNVVAEVGRNTLILCGAESMIKSIIPMMAEMVGLCIKPTSTLGCMVFVMVCFALAYKLLFPLINKYFPVLAGKI